MKKISIVTLASFVFLSICSFVEISLRGFLKDQLCALIIGAVILAISGVLAFVGKARTWLNVTCFFLSSVAMGFLLRAWFINRGFANSVGLMLFVSFLAVAYLWIFFALSRLPFIQGRKAGYIILCLVYAAVSAVGYLIVMTNTDTTYVSTFGYYMIIELAFIFAMSFKVNNKEELIRNLTLSIYSIFVVVIIVGVFVVIALLAGDGCNCDCDCGCDDCCCDCDCGGTGTTETAVNNKKKDTGIEIDPDGKL